MVSQLSHETPQHSQELSNILQRVRYSKSVRFSVITFATLSLVLAVAPPHTAEVQAAPIPLSHQYAQQKHDAQTLTVSAAMATPAVERDSYTVTSAAENAAAAAAVAQAEAAVQAAATAKRIAASRPAFTPNPPPSSYSGSAVLAYAAQFVGKVPYGSGNSPATSFSCDGFVQYVMAGFGINLPRGADHQAALGVRISQADARAGDLVWWPGQHVGIYDGAGGMYNSPNWERYVEHVGSLWGSPVFIRLR